MQFQRAGARTPRHLAHELRRGIQESRIQPQAISSWTYAGRFSGLTAITKRSAVHEAIVGRRPAPAGFSCCVGSAGWRPSRTSGIWKNTLSPMTPHEPDETPRRWPEPRAQARHAPILKRHRDRRSCPQEISRTDSIALSRRGSLPSLATCCREVEWRRSPALSPEDPPIERLTSFIHVSHQMATAGPNSKPSFKDGGEDP